MSSTAEGSFRPVLAEDAGGDPQDASPHHISSRTDTIRLKNPEDQAAAASHSSPDCGINSAADGAVHFFERADPLRHQLVACVAEPLERRARQGVL